MTVFQDFEQIPIIDQDVFEQILSLDEDEEEHDFSKDLVIKYFEQVEETFEQLKLKLKEKDLISYSKLGHFLKGSSGQLGLSRMQEVCKSMQDIGSQFQQQQQQYSLPNASMKINESHETLVYDPNLIELALYLFDQANSAHSASKQYLMDYFRLKQ